MKQKKFLIVPVLFLLGAACVFANTAISFGPAFTNYFVKTKIEGESVSAQIQGIVGDSVGKIKNEKNNAAGFALDIRSGLLYAMFQMAFTGKTHSDVFSGGTEGVKNSAIIFDTQLGAGFTFFKKTRFNLFTGAGVGLNTMYAKQTAKLPVVGTEFDYAKLDFMLGAGANILASFYLTKNIGICVGVSDTVYFVPLVTKKTFKINGKEYTLDQNSGTAAKNILANSLNIKAGVSVRF